MAASKAEKKKKKINCFECGHFYVTWDPKFPRGCRAMGFKSAEMPSEVVYEASGMACRKFVEKKADAP